MLNAKTIISLRRKQSTIPGTSAFVSGYHQPADGGGGIFVWTNDIVSPDDGGLVIVPSPQATRTGCWKRAFDGAINVRWFGAKGDGETDDTAAFQAMLKCFNYFSHEYGTPLPPHKTDQVRSFYIPAGTYRLTQELGYDLYPAEESSPARSPTPRLPYDVRITGDNRAASVLKFDMEEGTGMHPAGYPGDNYAVNIYLNHLQVLNQRSVYTGKTVGFAAAAGAYIYVSDCIFCNWNVNVRLDNTTYASVERTLFKGLPVDAGMPYVPDFTGVELGHDPAVSDHGWASTAVIAIRDCTFQYNKPGSTGIKIWGCNVADVSGNDFFTACAISVGNTGSLNICGNAAEAGYGYIEFTQGWSRNVNIVQNQIHGHSHAILIRESAEIFTLALTGNFFSVGVAAVGDPHGRLSVVHHAANILTTRNDGTIPPMFLRNERAGAIAENDTYLKNDDRHSLAFALRWNNANLPFPFYSITGPRNPGRSPVNNFQGSTISWLANLGWEHPEEGIGFSGEIRHSRELVLPEADTWTQAIAHFIPDWGVAHYEIRGIVANELFDNSWTFLAKGVCHRKGVLLPAFFQIVEQSRFSTYLPAPFDDLPDIGEKIQITLAGNELQVSVRGSLKEQWFLTMTITQKQYRVLA